MEPNKLKKMMGKVMSELGKKSHEKKPRNKKFYQDMANKRWSKRVKKAVDK